MSQQTILLVDDEPELVALVKLRLEANGYHVLTASDGAEGIEQARGEHPNLILLDISMPHMDGFLVYRRLQRAEQTRQIPCILLSGHAVATTVLAVLTVPWGTVVDCLIKPIDAQQLLASVQHALEASNGRGPTEQVT